MKPEFCNAKKITIDKDLGHTHYKVFVCNISSARSVSKKELIKQCPCNGDTNLCNQAISREELVTAKIGGAKSPELKKLK